MSQTIGRCDPTGGVTSAYGMCSFIVKREYISFSQQYIQAKNHHFACIYCCEKVFILDLTT